MSRYPAWKRIAIEEAREDIIYFMDEGYKVEMLTDYHWKINGVNVWPSSKKYQKEGHKVKSYNKLKDILKDL